MASGDDADFDVAQLVPIQRRWNLCNNRFCLRLLPILTINCDMEQHAFMFNH